MTRIYFGGEGDHIPPIALPDPHTGDAVPIILMMDNGEIFKPVDYIGLGYTYYQAWTVGAAGGYGSDVTDKYDWTTVGENRLPGGWGTYQRLMTTDEWNAYVALFYRFPYYRILDPAAYDPVTNGYRNLPDGSPPWIYVTPLQYAQIVNPGHIATVRVHDVAFMVKDSQAWFAPGGPGGGGLQVATGRLDELPPEVLCTVGQPGADQPTALSRIWTPTLDPVLEYTSEFDYSRGAYIDEFPPVHPLLYRAHVGGDGGYSSFGEVSKASGGMGSHSPVYFDATPGDYRLENRWWYSHGGSGGIGGRTDPGGGGGGANDQSQANGRDGTWNQNTGIGQGGGGGHGGYAKYPTGPTYGQGLILVGG